MKRKKLNPETVRAVLKGTERGIQEMLDQISVNDIDETAMVDKLKKIESNLRGLMMAA